MAHFAKLNKKGGKKGRKGRKGRKGKKKSKITTQIDSPVDQEGYDDDSTSNYDKIRALGEGATGQVLLVQNKKSNVQYAQKVVPVSSEMEKNRPLYAELNTLKNTRSEYIVGLESFFQQGFKMYVLLEFMDHGSVRDLITQAILQKKTIPEDVIRTMAKQTLEGLKYLHEDKEVIHRDIKPANVLVNSKGQAKLADLGMAGNKKKINYTYMGTMIYMSPERFLGKAHQCNCDVWSLGLTLAECALRNFPFSVDVQNPWGVFEILEKFRTQRNLLDGTEYSEEFKDFIDKMLTVEMEDRPEASTLLGHPFLKESDNKEGEQKLKDFLELVKKDFIKPPKKEEEEINEEDEEEEIGGGLIFM